MVFIYSFHDRKLLYFGFSRPLMCESGKKKFTLRNLTVLDIL